jgi:hypothetical protein
LVEEAMNAEEVLKGLAQQIFKCHDLESIECVLRESGLGELIKAADLYSGKRIEDALAKLQQLVSHVSAATGGAKRKGA